MSLFLSRKMSASSFISSYYFTPCALVALLLYFLISDRVLFYRIPPEPQPLPFVGNKLDIPKSQPWIQFQKWSEIYGPIFTLWLGRRPTLVISDPEVAVDLLEKRSNKYSSRPRFVTMGEIYWDMASILVQPYGRHWSIRRKLLHTALTPKALKKYLPVQTAEASRGPTSRPRRSCGQHGPRPSRARGHRHRKDSWLCCPEPVQTASSSTRRRFTILLSPLGSRL